MTPSLTPDPTRPATEGEEMRTAIHAWIREDVPLAGKMNLMPKHVGALIEKLSGPLSRLHSDLTAAREERDEPIERFAALVVEKAEQRIRAEFAEANLIALAKMYGEACGELAKAHLALDWDDVAFGMFTFRTMRERAEAAESEARTLRERVAKLEEVLKPFADVCEAANFFWIKNEQVLELATRAEVPISERLRGCHFRAAAAALSSSDPEKQNG